MKKTILWIVFWLITINIIPVITGTATAIKEKQFLFGYIAGWIGELAIALCAGIVLGLIGLAIYINDLKN